jgi:hypothetical protein
MRDKILQARLQPMEDIVQLLEKYSSQTSFERKLHVKSETLVSIFNE